MTALLRAPARFRRRRADAVPTAGAPAVAVPPLGARAYLARTLLVVVAVALGGLAVQVVVVSSFQQRAVQQRLFDQFRGELAQGTAPIGLLGPDGLVVAPGDPVAYLEIPAAGVRQVVVSGTSAAELLSGPGHRRDSPLPGQVGVSVLLGRQSSYGGPFGGIGDLVEGDEIRVTTGQGAFEYRVMGVRLDGAPAPSSPRAGEGRLLLVTADGAPFLPSGALRVDAELEDDAVAASVRPFSAATLPPEERIMAVADTRTLWALALWLQALLALALAAVWAWHRWGRSQAWVVFLPPLVVIGLEVSSETARLLPNLL